MRRQHLGNYAVSSGIFKGIFVTFSRPSKFLSTSNTKFNCSTVQRFSSPTLELYPDSSGLPPLSTQSVFLARTELGYLFQSLAGTDF